MPRAASHFLPEEMLCVYLVPPKGLAKGHAKALCDDVVSHWMQKIHLE